MSHSINNGWRFLKECFLDFNFQSNAEDVDTEREALQTSRAGLDDMCEDLKKQLKTETEMRLVSLTCQESVRN